MSFRCGPLLRKLSLRTDPPDHAGMRDLNQRTIARNNEFGVWIRLAEVAHRAVINNPGAAIRAELDVRRTIDPRAPLTNACSNVLLWANRMILSASGSSSRLKLTSLISYAVFCLKKKKRRNEGQPPLKLYRDQEARLLGRLIRFAHSPDDSNPT